MCLTFLLYETVYIHLLSIHQNRYYKTVYTMPHSPIGQSVIKRKFENYVSGNLFNDKDAKSMFYRWDFDKIWKESNKWKLRARWLYVYILANNCNFRTLHAHVGCTTNLYRRIAQHNGEIHGGPLATKKAAGHWKVLMYIVVPPYRNYSTKSIVRACKKGRGWPSRCKRAISLATKKGLDWRITRDIAIPESPYYEDTIVTAITDDANIKDMDTIYMESAPLIAYDLNNNNISQ